LLLDWFLAKLANSSSKFGDNFFKNIKQITLFTVYYFSDLERPLEIIQYPHHGIVSDERPIGFAHHANGTFHGG
jgi:hypothetical protein